MNYNDTTLNLNEFAKMMSIRDLDGKTFVIPTYQRGFRWTRLQMRDLIEDLHKFVKDRKDERKVYCLQPIVVKATDTDNYYEVIDGQQRLTAIWILSRLYDAFCEENGIETMKYSLFFEEKEDYTTLLKNFAQMITNCKKNKDFKAQKLFDEGYNGLKRGIETTDNELFDNLSLPFNDNNIDSQNFYNIIDFLVTYRSKESGKTLVGILNDIFDNLYDKYGEKDIQIIWDQMDDENVIDKFANINANKIALTEAELIKANLIHRDDDNDKHAMVHQWESIERGLSNDNFWYFFAAATKDYDTRIDFLFEIWLAEEKNNLKVSYKDHVLSRSVNQFLESKGGNDVAKNLWSDIVQIYDTLCDWYNDYELFHIIGLYLEVSDLEKGSSKADLVQGMYREFLKKDRSAFKSWLIAKIRKQRCYKVICDEEKEKGLLIDESAIKDALQNYNYEISDKKEIKAVLLLYNIALLVNSKNVYERFPFDKYKTTKWDIEHINARSKSDRVKDGLEVNVARKIYDPENEFALLKDEEFVQIIEKKFDINKISNLCILDQKTNRSYKDKPFNEKRATIIKVMRSEQENPETESQYLNTEEIILPGTRWVFLKEGADEDLKLWSPEKDYDSYIANIAKNIFKFLYAVEHKKVQVAEPVGGEHNE